MPRRKTEPAAEANRRTEVLRAAARLFVEKGFEATTTRDIAEAAGMRSGSPFYHFRSKLDLLKAVILEGLAASEARQQAAIAGVDDPLDRLHRLVRAHLGSLFEHDTNAPLLIGETRALDAAARRQIAEAFDRYQIPWQQTLDALVAQGTLTSAAPPLRLWLFGMLNWSTHWYRPDGAMTLDALADSAVAMLLGQAPG
ncbi:TetR/AcrR family transcriptional regulator [Denitromonas iodatirespirans]|uniref:TetR family transcriptional regulator n=1 Tax=Denitromonas iodatirespirans TaxID=2795389 RepID=A0A944D994_DENI1|nr:TetR/AcrR family transcriptional regulator [Denitromonas iodatirespirans]MBT0961017.1 TetR family transcriptional regulator [Denitromonas iodatirespirans]